MKKSYKVALSGIFLALSAGLSAAESLLPLPMGVKPGFSNLPILIAMWEISPAIGFSICIMRSVSVFLMRGFTAFVISLSGGLLSYAVMLILYKKTRRSYVFISAAGGAAHNTGQMLAAMLIMKSTAIVYYIFILVISGLVSGVITGYTAKLIIPKLEPFLRRKK